MNGIIIYNGTYPSGSWPQRVRLTSRGLKYYGIETKILISFWPPLVEEKKESDDNVIFLWKPVLNKTYEHNKFLYLFYYLFGILKGYFFLRKQKNLDFIIFAQGSFLECFLIKNYCKRNNIKFIIDLVDENAKKYEKKSSIKDIIGVINRDLYEKVILKKCDYLFVISSYLYEKYKRLYPNLEIIRSTPSLIDLDEFNERKKINLENVLVDKYEYLKSKKNKFLYAGSCARPNGIFFFIENLIELNKRLDFDYFLIFFISEGNIKILEDKLNELNLIDKYFIQNAVPQKFIPAIYENLADYLILPEHGLITANAGFPSKTAELLAAGKPIIATKFSDLAEYLINEKNALISELGNKKDYQKNLEKVLFDKKLCEQISINAIKTAEEFFDYKKGIRKFVKILRKN
jgi:glycosyltransferase involved in cell wall biosynthesis